MKVSSWDNCSFIVEHQLLNWWHGDMSMCFRMWLCRKSNILDESFLTYLWLVCGWGELRAQTRTQQGVKWCDMSTGSLADRGTL